MDVRPQPDRFHDGGSDTEPPAPGSPARIVLERDASGGRELFVMRRRIGYLDRRHGELLVPADLAGFRTDLTSVPALFTWLVPRTGNHLAPALLHDGLVGEGRGPTHVGPPLDRVEADRVFRDAMRDSHVGPVRRWLVWAAVTLGTIRVGSTAWSRAAHLRYAAAAAATLLVIVVLGVLATLDLFDVVTVLPWMGERPWWLELVGGVAAAIAIPVVLGATWGRLAVAGIVSGVALAVLLHVTAVLALLTVLYQAAEWLARRAPSAALGLAVAVVAMGAAVALVLSLA